MNVTAEKAALRARTRLAGLTRTGDMEVSSARAQSVLLGMRAFRDAGSVGCYFRVKGEVDLAAVIAECRRERKALALPSSLPAGGYVFRAWHEGSAMTSGRFGIPEPADGETLPLSDLDLVLVPGVAFDSRGGRLGRGGGFYDRLLAGRSVRRPFLVGVAFSWQMVENVPMGPEDVAVDCVVTEDGIAGGSSPAVEKEA
jgi:5-formyltetrahydrofolate cyclo-ligase